MVKTRRVIRTTQPAGRSAFDEQFWPVILSVVVLGGFLLGTVSAYLESDDPRWYANAWTWIFAIPVVTCLAIWGLRYVNSRRVRRGIQLSAILGVMVHVLLFVVARETDIFGRLWEELAHAAHVPQPREPLIEPEYPSLRLDPRRHSRQIFSTPVEVETPDPSETEMRPQKTRDPQQHTAAEEAPPPQPEQQMVASLPQRPVAAKTVPRYAEQTAQLSRQRTDVRPQTESPQPQPEAAPEQDLSPLSPRQTALAPRATPNQDRRRQQPIVDSRTVARTSRLDRQREPQAPQAERIETRDVPRTTPARVERARTDVELPQRTSRTTEPIQAQAATPRRRPPGARSAESPAAAPAETQSTLHTPADRPVRQQPEQLAATAAAAPRVARRLAAPEIAAAAQVEATGSADAPSTSLQPQVPATSRAAEAVAALDHATLNPRIGQTPAPPTPGTQRGQQQRAAAIATTPDTESTNSTSIAIARASRPAGIETRHQVQRTTSNPRAESGADDSAEPVRMALTRSLSGSTGVGQAPNLDRAFSAPDSPAMIASGSARRASATQQMPAGPALAPSTAAIVRHSLAGGQRPGATLQATTPQAAAERGAARPAELNATASAASRRAASDADPATVTAAAGTIDVDMGPTRVVTGGGARRAAGGGQPDLQLEGSVRDLARRLPASHAAGAPGVVEQPAAPVAARETETSGNQNALGNLAATVTDARREAAVAAGTQSLAATSPTAPATTRVTPPLSLARSAGTTGAADRDTEQGALHRVRRRRDTRGPQFPTNGPRVAASSPAPTPAGSPHGVAPSSVRARRSAGPGVAAEAPAEAASFAAGDPAHTTPPLRRRVAGEPAGPQLADAAAASTPRRGLLSPTSADGPPVTAATAAEASAGREAAQASAAEALAANTALDRRPVGSAGAIPLDVDLDPGPGGLGAEPDLEAGIRSRRASRDSMQIELRTGRFRRQQVGGLPTSQMGAVVATEPFRSRSDRVTGNDAPVSGAPGPETEQAIELGLAFLARYQLPDGSWSLQAFDEEVALGSDTAATGLALLAFQGAGYNHREHQYADVVANAIDYLTKSQSPEGDLFVPVDDGSNMAVWLYSHGIAALALSEAYGMTQDPELARPAQQAINFIVSAQDKQHGGWRYRPGFSSDTSVSGWMMMALKSAELANLKVPEATYDRARKWLDLAQASHAEPHLYRYNPFAADTPSQRHGRSPTPSMTAVGLLLRLYDGWRRNQESMVRGADHLLENLPARGSRQRPQRDTYYWYYATQVMFHMGGDYWKQWNGRLHPLLIESQISQGPFAGSWNPNSPVPDRWAPHAGRLYVTTMNLLSLEVFYRHLPLYENTAR